MANVIIKLLEPIEGPSTSTEPNAPPTMPITEVVLRPPKYADVMALGEPAAFARSEGGMVYTAERDDVIEGYIIRLLHEPKNPQLLRQLGLADTLRLRDAVFDFFKAARQAI